MNRAAMRRLGMFSLNASKSGLIVEFKGPETDDAFSCVVSLKSA